MKEEYNQATLWVPIAYEYPTHVSIDHGNEFTGRDTLQTARYTFIGTVAARELLFPPDVMLSEIDPRELRRINKDFERVIGDFGAILKATLEYINLGSPAGTGEVFTTARLAVLENETEYGLLSKKNPSIYFTKA
jgi:hypothetical protein